MRARYVLTQQSTQQFHELQMETVFLHANVTTLQTPAESPPSMPQPPYPKLPLLIPTATAACQTAIFDRLCDVTQWTSVSKNDAAILQSAITDWKQSNPEAERLILRCEVHSGSHLSDAQLPDRINQTLEIIQDDRQPSARATAFL